MLGFIGDDAGPALWGMVLLAAWVGWGELVRRFLGAPSAAAGLGLRAGWGMAFVLAAGGLLQALHACNAAFLTVLVVAGLVPFAAVAAHAAKRMWRAHDRASRAQGWALSWALPTVVLAAIYLLSVKASYLNNWDDYPAYLVFPHDLLARGIIDQPFSLRRLLTFGGQAELDAMLFLHAGVRNVDILEMGLGRIVMVALVAGAVRPRGRGMQLLAGVFLAGLALVPREHLPTENVHSELTGLVLFLTLLRTLGLRSRPRLSGWRIPVVAAAAAAGVSAMRVSNLPAAVLMIALFYLGRMLLDRRHVPRHLARLALAAVAFAAFLLPWSLALRQTSGTLLDPPWPGTQRPEYAFLAGSAPLPLLAKLRWVAGFFVMPMQSDHLPLGLVIGAPLLLALYRRHWRAELPVAVAGVVTAVMILLEFTLGWYDTMYRYIFPLLFGTSAVLVYRALLRPATVGQRTLGIAAACAMALVYVPLGAWWLVAQRPVVPSWRISIDRVASLAPEYRAAQASVPAGAAIFSASSLPMHFDFARNRIFIADVPGAASPAPGMPLDRGPGGMAAYLKGRGIDYVIYSNDDIQNMYNRAYWEDLRAGRGDQTPDIENVKQFYFDFLGDLDGLPAQGRVLFHDQTLTVVGLSGQK